MTQSWERPASFLPRGRALCPDLSSHTGSGIRGIGVPDLDFHSARALLDRPDSGRHASMGGNRRRVAGAWARSGQSPAGAGDHDSAGGVLYPGFDAVGFIPTAFIALAILFAVLGVRPVLVPILAAGITMVVHYGFYSLLRVPWAWGVLTPWAW